MKDDCSYVEKKNFNNSNKNLNAKDKDLEAFLNELIKCSSNSLNINEKNDLINNDLKSFEYLLKKQLEEKNLF